MKDILQKLIAEAEESDRVAAAATWGPWKTEGGMNLFVFTEDGEGMIAQARGTGYGIPEEEQACNMKLAAHSRTALPRHAKQVKILVEALMLVMEQRDNARIDSAYSPETTDRVLAKDNLRIAEFLAQLEEK